MTHTTPTPRRRGLDVSTAHVPGQIALPGLDEEPPVDLTEPELVAWYEQRDELAGVVEDGG